MDSVHIALAVIIVVQMVLSHLRRKDCEEAQEANARELARNIRGDMRTGANIVLELISQKATNNNCPNSHDDDR